MSDPPRPGTLHKQLSWSTDTYRDEAWLRKKEHCTRRRRSRSVTDDDLDELKGCIELGFGFCSGSPKLDRKLSDTFPALDFYYAVNRRYSDGVLARTASGSSDVSDSSTEADAGTIPESIFGPGVYCMCDRRRLSNGPYLAITTLCSFISLGVVSLKACVFGGVIHMGAMKAMFISSLYWRWGMWWLLTELAPKVIKKHK